MNRKPALIDGSINQMLIRMTIPMIIGIMGMVIYNLVDTFFVGQIGSKELAAMSYTFPVVMFIGSISFGLGVGTSSTISRAIGENNTAKIRRLTTDALILSFIVVIIIAVTGILLIDPIFRGLGAGSDLLPLIKEYMTIWFLSAPFIVTPMVGNSAIRATGDTKTPGMIMVISIIINIMLDPLFIFGIGPFPRMGLTGAAIATLLARAFLFVFAIWVLYKREKMITYTPPEISIVFNSWKQMLYVGLPAALTNLIGPVSIGIVTRIISDFGDNAVAGFGVAGRIQMIVMSVIMALSTVLVPFVGQNFGAGRIDRVCSGVKSGHVFSLIWGLITFFIFLFISENLASLFNKNEEIIKVTSMCLIISSAGYGVNGVLRLSCASLNALNKPFHSGALMYINMFVLLVPLSFGLSKTFGMTGVFYAMPVSSLIAGGLSFFTFKRIIRGI